MADDPTVLVRREGRLGHLRLNRPRAINALTTEMVASLRTALDAWADDDAVEVVALDGAGERGLCAGGDVRMLHDAARDGDLAPAEEFWRAEYALDERIATYPKPVVAYLDGIVMGGGIGLAGHARHRLVTSRSRIAMPETGIGYTPDVGASYLLTRRPDSLGAAAALTGVHLGAADAIATGFADAWLDHERWPDLLARLAGEPVGTVLADLTGPPPTGESALDDDALDRVFAADDVVTAVARLHDEPSLSALAAAADRASPLSLAVTWRALQRARAIDRLHDALEQDMTLSMAFVRHPEFVEGVRAAVVDKDRTPRWTHADVADVTTDEVDAFWATPYTL